MGENTIYYISEAAKKVQVEAHVLRYWEEELQLAIRRNEMGHRCYTSEDIEKLQKIKALKEQGLQLKAIRTFLCGGSMIPGTEKMRQEKEDNLLDKFRVTGQNYPENRTKVTEPVEENIKQNKEAEGQKEERKKEESKDSGVEGVGLSLEGMNPMGNVENMDQKVEDMVMKKAKKYMVTLSKGKEPVIETPQDELPEYTVQEEMDKTQKAARLQYLLQHMVSEAVKSANREMCTEIKESILKELDYQFRQQEERDEEHWKKEEEHYRKIDEMIRQRHLPKEKLSKGKRKSPINL